MKNVVLNVTICNDNQFRAIRLVPVHPYWKTFENLRAQSILYDVGQLEQTRLS